MYVFEPRGIVGWRGLIQLRGLGTRLYLVVLYEHFNDHLIISCDHFFDDITDKNQTPVEVNKWSVSLYMIRNVFMTNLGL